MFRHSGIQALGRSSAPVTAAVLISLIPAVAQADNSALSAPSDGAPGSAAGAVPAPNPLEPRVRELEETVKKLQALVQTLQDQAKGTSIPAMPPSPTPAPLVTPAQVGSLIEEKLKQQKPLVSWDKGFCLESPDGSARLRIRGLLQQDSRAFTAGGGHSGIDSLFLRRARPILEGTIQKNLDFRLMPDFGQGAVVLQDAYFNYRFAPEYQLLAGKVKQPFSLERLQNAPETLFIERSISNDLAPIRDVGVQLHGDVGKGTLSYALAVFNGAPDSGSVDGDAGNDKEIAGRVFVHPFRHRENLRLQELGVGLAATVGRRDESLAPVNFRSNGRSSFFRYASGVNGAGTQVRLAPQAYLYRGSAGLMGEYIVSDQRVQKGSTRGDLTHSGWFIQGSYVLTGEKASYRNVAPRRPFDPQHNRWGAFELAARYSRVDLDEDTFNLGFASATVSASEARAWALGLNWYLNRALKLQLNWERTDFNQRISFGNLKLDHEDVFLSRLQVTF